MDAKGLRKDVLGQNREGTVLRKAPSFPDPPARLHALGRSYPETGRTPEAHVSQQTALLRKRKMQRIPENAGNTVLSGEVWVDHTYINAPMSVRKGKKRGGLAGTGDSEDAFLGHIAPGSCVYHDMGHFSAAAFQGAGRRR